MDRSYFHEDQYFRKSWIWLAIAVVVVVAIATVGALPRTTLAAIVTTVLVGVAVTAVFFFARLETEVRPSEVVIRFHGLWPTRRIPVVDIEKVEARRYSMWESGGWGVHLGLAGMAYNVSGNDGVFLRLRKGGRVLIGSQRAPELAAAIREAVRLSGEDRRP